MDNEFKACYYAILHKQAEIALTLACQSMPSVAYGYEQLGDKIDFYLEEAKTAPELEEFLNEFSENEPPQRLMNWLMQKVKEYHEKTEASSGTERNSEGKES